MALQSDEHKMGIIPVECCECHQGRADWSPEEEQIQKLFASVPDSIFTAFRCYTGECMAEGGAATAHVMCHVTPLQNLQDEEHTCMRHPRRRTTGSHSRRSVRLLVHFQLRAVLHAHYPGCLGCKTLRSACFALNMLC